MFQGASVAFDLSMEEIWIPYLVGASLFVATPQIIGETETLPDLLEEAGVTVLDTVPTLLSVLPRDVKTLRRIILGGEACPPSVAERWSRPGRTIFNSYGPTEATVVATVAEVRPGEPVTIGRPIPNYTCYVVDEALQLLAAGRRRRIAHRRPRRRARLFEARRTDGGKIHRQSVRVRRRRPDPLSLRRRCAARRERRHRLSRPHRRSDQDQRLSRRTRRNRSGALPTSSNVRQAAVVLRNENGVDELVAFLVHRGTARATRANCAAICASFCRPT